MGWGATYFELVIYRSEGTHSEIVINKGMICVIKWKSALIKRVTTLVPCNNQNNLLEITAIF